MLAANVVDDISSAYSRLSNESTGTMKKTDPNIEAVRTFFAVLLAITQEFEMLC